VKDLTGGNRGREEIGKKTGQESVRIGAAGLGIWHGMCATWLHRIAQGCLCRMNCFQHPDEIGIVSCRGCDRQLCSECSQQSIQGVTQVCSDECARKVRPPRLKRLFDSLYASLFIILLMTVCSGGLTVLLAQSGRVYVERQQSNNYYSYRDRYGGQNEEVYRVFHLFGIEDWRMHFAIGSGVGFVGAIAWLRRYWAKGIVT